MERLGDFDLRDGFLVAFHTGRKLGDTGKGAILSEIVTALAPVVDDLSCLTRAVRHVHEGRLNVLVAADAHLVSNKGVRVLRSRPRARSG